LKTPWLRLSPILVLLRGHIKNIELYKLAWQRAGESPVLFKPSCMYAALLSFQKFFMRTIEKKATSQPKVRKLKIQPQSGSINSAKQQSLNQAAR